MFKDFNLNKNCQITIESAVKTNVINNDTIVADYYPPNTNQSNEQYLSKNLVILLHGFGAKPDKLSNYQNFLNFLTKKGCYSIFIHLPYHLKRTPPGEKSGERLIYFDDIQTFNFFKQAVLDIKKIINFAKNNLNFNKIALCGFSLGSMLALITTALETSISKCVLIFGGGDWHEIHWNSLLSFILKGNCLAVENDIITKKKCKEIYKTFKDFEEKCKKLSPEYFFNTPLTGEIDLAFKKYCFLCDPLIFANFINSDKVLMLNSKLDHYFNKKSTLKLWQRLKKPKIYWFYKPHTSKILLNKKAQDIILNFLKKS